jgi:hypothetical protein
MTKKEFYNNKIDFIINQCKFLKKYYKKGTTFDQIENELNNLKEFNAFLHRVIDQKESEIKRYESYRNKYYNLKNNINKPAAAIGGIKDQFGRSVNKRFYFPFT